MATNLHKNPELSSRSAEIAIHMSASCPIVVDNLVWITAPCYNIIKEYSNLPLKPISNQQAIFIIGEDIAILGKNE